MPEVLLHLGYRARPAKQARAEITPRRVTLSLIDNSPQNRCTSQAPITGNAPILIPQSIDKVFVCVWP